LVADLAAEGVAVLHFVQYELMLAAAVGLLLLGIEDLVFDLVWLLRGTRQYPSPTSPPLTDSIAIFVPAWQESNVLPVMLDHMLTVWHTEDVIVFVGCYPNDPETIGSVQRVAVRDTRVRLVVHPLQGPTTKADNLNQLWRALGVEERSRKQPVAAVVLHDAEDRVHPAEISLFRRYLSSAAMVQIPVEPILRMHQGAVANHYADEFAEAHAKEMPLRSSLRSALPAAGVGCAFRTNALRLLALERPDGPFNADSLTEDYELGLILGARGLRCLFVDERAVDGTRVASQSDFPSDFEACVRQKSRWIAGIALSGWDRLGWDGAETGTTARHKPSRTNRLITHWMLWRDRRSSLSALLVLIAYLAFTLSAIDLLGSWIGWWVPLATGKILVGVIGVTTMLMLWRLLMRCYFTGSIYGWCQALRAIPRAFLGNVIHVFAARRALVRYLREMRTQQQVWEKTEHHLSWQSQI
jgi:bacteriophage N4 adsorption protein B